MLKTGKILSNYYNILEQEKQCTSGKSYTKTPSTKHIQLFNNNTLTGNENLFCYNQK